MGTMLFSYLEYRFSLTSEFNMYFYERHAIKWVHSIQWLHTFQCIHVPYFNGPMYIIGFFNEIFLCLSLTCFKKISAEIHWFLQKSTIFCRNSLISAEISLEILFISAEISAEISWISAEFSSEILLHFCRNFFNWGGLSVGQLENSYDY